MPTRNCIQHLWWYSTEQNTSAKTSEYHAQKRNITEDFQDRERDDTKIKPPHYKNGAQMTFLYHLTEAQTPSHSPQVKITARGIFVQARTQLLICPWTGKERAVLTYNT